MSQFNKGVSLIIISAASFGLLPLFATYAYQAGVNVTTLLFLRFTIASSLFFGYLIVRRENLSVNRSQLVSLMLLGGVLYNMQSNLYFSSVQYIPASLAVLLLYTYPVFVTLLASVVDREAIGKKVWFAIGISFLGLILVLGTSFGKVNLFGVSIAFGAAVVYSCYIVLGNRVIKGISPLVTSSFVTLFAAIALLLTGLVKGSLDFSFPTEGWLPVLGIVIFPTLIAISTFFKGMEYIGSTRASILSMIEPLVTIGFSAWLLGERMSFIQGFGSLIVITGALLVVLEGEKNKEQATGV